MKRYLIGMLLIFLSCTTNKELCAVRDNLESHFKILMRIPKNYSGEMHESIEEKEIRYIYEDSSFIYITNFTYTPNYKNIMNLSDSVFQYRFQNEELTREVNAILGKQFLTVLPDTFELSGHRDSLYWKDIKIGKISIGYINVPKEKKKLFDKSLKTFKKRQ